MSDYLEVTLTGSDGSVWDLSGPAAGDQGVEMRPKTSGLFEPPNKTLWIKSAFGSKYQGHKVQRRDVIFSVQIYGTHAAEWRDVDSRFRMALGNYDTQFTLTFTTEDGPRSLKLRLLEQPKPYESGGYEDHDPNIFADSTMTITAAAEQPYWEGEVETASWTLASGTSGSGTITLPGNPGDVPIWPRWTVTAPSKWTLPDRSWGQDLFNAAVADATRTVVLPTLLTGEDSHCDANPQEEAIIAANGAPVWQRWNGRGILYPIPPHTPPQTVPISVTSAVAGASVVVEFDRWYSRPWGVSSWQPAS
ncbi:hypothetical protein [Rhodococcus opacus]|uniref:Minor tail protein n=1 Tax=Rhodococcus opacus TaxID=37919 RepID=A0A2S8JAV0_RHOOP|nr:hypothetical protein [Rhodococcus opacus]PQP24168.1 hypothetical protein C5613_14910 [Rhodococcus opacus]